MKQFTLLYATAETTHFIHTQKLENKLGRRSQIKFLTLFLKTAAPPILSLLRSRRLAGLKPRFLRTTTSESELSVR